MSEQPDIETSEVVCPVCDRFVYNSPRCTCTGQSLRAEIEKLRASMTPKSLHEARDKIVKLEAEIERLRAAVHDIDKARSDEIDQLRAEIERLRRRRPTIHEYDTIRQWLIDSNWSITDADVLARKFVHDFIVEATDE